MTTEKRYIDLTPTWEGIFRHLLLCYTDGGFEGRKMAEEELRRMAQLADKYVESQKEEEE